MDHNMEAGTKALHPDFGIDMGEFSLRTCIENGNLGELRDLFERQSLLRFRDQNLSDDEILALGELFGQIETREDDRSISVSNMSTLAEDGSVMDEHDLRTINLKANQLWHTDSTFLPVPALCNILQARVVTSTGGATEFASTRAGFARLSPDLQERLRNTVFTHRASHSRTLVNKELAKERFLTKWPDTHWRAVWVNPVTGEESVYIASHACGVNGEEGDEAQMFVDGLIAAMTRPQAVYAHNWKPGDVLIWDERSVLHRATPWPYDEPRTLASICVSVEADDWRARMAG